MTELEIIGSQISYADLRFLYFIPAERRSAGTIANVVVARKMKLDASQFVCLSMTTINKAFDFNS